MALPLFVFDLLIGPDLDKFAAGEETASQACARLQKILLDDPLKEVE